ncbi:MAG TPA: hypothetical protein PKY05_18670 [Fibrobacteria bacterium]|nr:hypothetical protein [Fibrobacteria bacterium]
MKRTALLLPILVATAALAQAPKGAPVVPDASEQAKLAALRAKANGIVVWSSSRVGNHKIFAMDADGQNTRQVTKGNKTDWYPRISPDGKRILFTRSKLDWTAETNANFAERWDTWIVNVDGSGEKLLVPNSTWATWRPDGSILFSRGADVFTAKGDGTGEAKLVDGKTSLKGGIAQNPNMSTDGKFLAITLRGSERSVGVLNLSTKQWFESASGGGCQMTFFPGGHRVVRVNPTGNGGTELYAYELDASGKHGALSANQQKWIDLPGRRSHEYFPQLSQDGKWLVWAATDRGHDHDIADYEIHLLKVGESADKAVRLTFHSGNDRWPDAWMK